MKICILIILIFSICIINANILNIFFFDYNYFIKDSLTVLSDDTLILPMEKFNNTLFILITDIYINSYLIYGPNAWDYNTNTFYFFLDNNNITYTFQDFFENTNTFSKTRFEAIIKTNMDKRFLFIYYLYNTFKEHSYKLNTLYNMAYKNSTFKQILSYHIANNSKNFLKAYKIMSKLKNIYKNDKDVFYLYVLSIMNNGDFYNAENQINLFYKNKQKDIFYYSLLMNINAIKGNFKNAINIIERGRSLFPDSKILLNDALNLYSIIDTLKYRELKEILFSQ